MPRKSAEYYQQWRRRRMNDPEYRAKNTDRVARQRQRAREHANVRKVACAICGARPPTKLEWHHRDGRDGPTTIARLIQDGAPIARIDAELALCDCLCGTCHRRVHKAKTAAHPLVEYYQERLR